MKHPDVRESASNNKPIPEGSSEHSTETSPLSAAQAEGEALSEVQEENHANGEHKADAESGSESNADEAEGSEATAREEGGVAPKKKRKRRRKKKKEGAEAEANGAEKSAHAKGGAHGREAPLSKFVEGSHGPGRRHAFSLGEIVAGRVTQLRDNLLVVDLFGKATAILDASEPREIETPPDTNDAAHAEEAASGAAGADATSQKSQVDDMPTVRIVSTVYVSDMPAAAVSEIAAAMVSPPKQILPPPQVGEILRGRVAAVSESGHIAIVNRWIDKKKTASRWHAAKQSRERVSGIVFGFNRGGFDILLEGCRAFCPASGMALGAIPDPSVFVAQRFEFTVSSIEDNGSGLVVSRRSLLEKEALKVAKERMQALEVGQNVRGHVVEVLPFGLVIDLNGIEGFAHQSELSWARVKPEDVAKVGDELEFQIIKIEPIHKKERRGRVSLSTRVLQPHPWDLHKEWLKEGVIRKGKVARIAEFGAFLELAEGIDGLLHISELGREVQRVDAVISVDDEMDVVIERVDRGQNRISLSKLSAVEIKLAAEFEAEAGKRPPAIKPGAHVTILVDHLDHRGLHGQIKGVLGKRGRVFVSQRDLGNAGGDTNHRKTLATGTEMRLKITGMERDGSYTGSVRALASDEERRAVQDYRREASKQGLGTFGDLLRAKLGENRN